MSASDDLFLARYTEMTDPERLLAALQDEGNIHIRVSFERHVGTKLTMIDETAKRGAVEAFAAHVKKHPAFIVEAFASHEVNEPRETSTLSSLLKHVPGDSPPSEKTLNALKESTKKLVERTKAVLGDELKIDVEAFSRHGRPLLDHLLHASADLPDLGSILASKPRVAIPSAFSTRAPETSENPGSRSPPPSETPSSTSKTGKDDAAAILGKCDPATHLGSNGEGPSITFPGKLSTKEEIYYDFSILMPLDEVLTPQEEEALTAQETEFESTRGLAFDALVGLAGSVIKTLDDAGLGGVFGSDTAGTTTLLASVWTRIDDYRKNPSHDTRTIETRRRALRELAAALRLIARMRLHVAPTQLQGLDQVAGLLARIDAVTGIDPATNQNRFRWSTAPKVLPDKRGPASEHGLPVHHLQGEPNADLPWYAKPVLTHADVAGPPDAVWGALGTKNAQASPHRYFNWLYHSGNLNPVRDYLEGLGNRFSEIQNYQNLAREAGDLLANLTNQINSGKAGTSEYLRKVEQLLGGLVNDAAYALGTILEELAELLEVPHHRRVPGTKRLAVQVIYRQRWESVGYVMGKLVGYKTLIPGETLNVKRRTFVKTQREVTSTTDFASSRQNDFSQTQRETSEVTRETGDKFGFQASASGHFDFLVGGAEVSAQAHGDISSTSKAVRSSLTEATAKGTVSFNNKREVKVRDYVENEVTEESSHELKNANLEITANYFYYQLLREYELSTELLDVRPVILVARDYPTAAQIDEVWLGKHLHDIIAALPAQLAVDADGIINGIEQLARKMIRARSHAARTQADYELRRDTLLDPAKNPGPLDDKQRESITQAAASANEAREAFRVAETDFHAANARLSRVVSHVRENILFYMHRLWQANSNIDREHVLRNETYRGDRLDRLTRGLNRVGFLGPEEIYEFTGKSAPLLQLMLEFMTKGGDVMSRPDGDLLKERLIERVQVEQPLDRAGAIAWLNSALIVGEAPPTLSIPRRVQVAQDAVLVEAMPGKVSLLEGFKLAHRALDVQRACLENQHLAARIADKPWQSDTSVEEYKVIRREGETS